jgi:hypothetical protein
MPLGHIILWAWGILCADLLLAAMIAPLDAAAQGREHTIRDDWTAAFVFVAAVNAFVAVTALLVWVLA